MADCNKKIMEEEMKKATPPPAEPPPSEPPPAADDAAIKADLTALKDEMCACKDKACGDGVMGKLGPKVDEAKKAFPNPTDDQKKFMGETKAAVDECYGKLK
jgi:hypothetical protein